MVKIKQYNSKISAEMDSLFLNAQGILTQIIGAKDYSSHITGLDEGLYHLLVPEEHTQLALTILSDRNSHKNHIRLAQSDDEDLYRKSANYYFKRAVINAFFSVIFIPIVFNYISLKNLNSFIEIETRPYKKILASIIILTLQIPAFYFIYVTIKFLLDYFYY